MKQFIKKLFPKIVLFSLLLTTCISLINCKKGPSWQQTKFIYFDTVCQVHIFCSGNEFKEAQEKIHQVFAEIENHFSPDKNDYTSPIVIELFNTAKDIYKVSGGIFDLTVAPLSRLWGFRNGEYYVPTKKELQALLPLIGMDKVCLEKDRLTLPPGVELDWGGIAKGYGIELAYQSLKDMGIKKGFINSGGDLYCWGLNPEGKPWRIGIKHPRKNGFLGILFLTDTAATTTGDYQRYFIKDGVRYHHIFDPRSGYPARGKQSVTVIGPDPTLCDALSTALFISETPEKIINQFPDYGAIIMDEDGKLSFIGKHFPFHSVD